MKGYFSLILTHLISPLGGEKTKAEVVTAHSKNQGLLRTR